MHPNALKRRIDGARLHQLLQAVVQQITMALQQAGIDVWVAHEQLTPGTPNWDASIRAGIAQATHGIYMASSDAVQSSYVLSELHLARNQQKIIIPFWLAGDAWVDVMPLGVGVT